MQRSMPWVELVSLALLVALPALLSPYTTDLVVTIVVMAVFALSLELLVGMTGLVSLGHAAYFGIGAYTTVLLSPQADPGNVLLLVLLSALAAAAYALVVGLLSLRTKGVYFIMVTLAFAQMAYFVFHDTQLGGGTDGIYLNVRPTLGLVDTGDRLHFYYLVVSVLALTYGLLAVLRRSRFGHALAGIRVNEQRMRATGFATTQYKLAAFVLAGALAGVAGSLLAIKDGFVNPELLSWHESGAVLLMIILGGIGHLRGAVLGAVAFVMLKEWLATPALVGDLLADHWQLTLGLTIIAFVALLPKGLIGLPQRWARSS
jgi:branched-chain amino acid transport system permease protein